MSTINSKCSQNFETSFVNNTLNCSLCKTTSKKRLKIKVKNLSLSKIKTL